VGRIGNNAFQGCSSLKTVTYKGINDPGADSKDVFLNCSSLSSCVVVPDTFTSKKFCGLCISRGDEPDEPGAGTSITPTLCVFITVAVLAVINFF